jgi:uncharacterized membrane protein
VNASALAGTPRGRIDRGSAAVVAFAALGFAVALYLTTVHYADVAPVCAAVGSAVDCSAVTQSTWSVVPGTALPVTVPGMLWFAVSGGLAVAALRGGDSPRLRRAQLAWCGAGLAGVLYFVYAELVLLHRICEWCTVVHLLVLATFLVALVRVLPAEAEVQAEVAIDEA